MSKVHRKYWVKVCCYYLLAMVVGKTLEAAYCVQPPPKLQTSLYCLVCIYHTLDPMILVQK